MFLTTPSPPLERDVIYGWSLTAPLSPTVKKGREHTNLLLILLPMEPDGLDLSVSLPPLVASIICTSFQRTLMASICNARSFRSCSSADLADLSSFVKYFKCSSLRNSRTSAFNSSTFESHCLYEWPRNAFCITVAAASVLRGREMAGIKVMSRSDIRSCLTLTEGTSDNSRGMMETKRAEFLLIFVYVIRHGKRLVVNLNNRVHLQSYLKFRWTPKLFGVLFCWALSPAYFS